MHNCKGGLCWRCRGAMKVCRGALLLLNAFVWPKWLGVDGWVSWVAVLLIVSGVLKMLKSGCGHCEMPMPEAGMKRRKR